MRPEEVEVARGGLAAWGDVLVLDADGPTNGRALMMAFLEFLQPGAAARDAELMGPVQPDSHQKRRGQPLCAHVRSAEFTVGRRSVKGCARNLSGEI